MIWSLSKEAREHAKTNKLALFAVEVDGRPSKDGMTGCYCSDGPANIDMARALFFFALEMTKGAKPPTPAHVKKTFAKFFPNGRPVKHKPKAGRDTV